jgi:four helix bundle protein
MGSQRKYDLNDRLVNYAVKILKLIDSLPQSMTVKHLSNQLMRSATSTALNYGEAQGAESSKDFVHKMRIVLKELRESKNCLLILEGYEAIEGGNSELSETSELIAIFTKSIETASKK